MPKLSFDINELAKVWPEAAQLTKLPRKKKKRLKKRLTVKILTVIDKVIKDNLSWKG